MVLEPPSPHAAPLPCSSHFKGLGLRLPTRRASSSGALHLVVSPLLPAAGPVPQPPYLGFSLGSGWKNQPVLGAATS